MGIRYLNKYLRYNCINSIRCINMSELSGKSIAIDISIYLYKYETDNTLLENIYLMLSIFKYYNIIPIFIFDGKPPKEKTNLLKKRKDDKLIAENEYKQLEIILKETTDETDKDEIITTMAKLKKQFVYINKDKISRVKELIRAHGATYYDAPGEADVLCAMLVIQNKVWACLSEDMDLFVYGCKRVLRYLSLMNHNVVLYHMKGILNELELKQDEFKKMCILSGTDYNLNSNSNQVITFNKIIYLFRKFKNNNTYSCFYNWLKDNTNYINNINNIDILNKTYKLFDISFYNKYLDNFRNIKIINGPILQNNIEEIMKEEGFIFI
jgi:flap endonuclease-1